MKASGRTLWVVACTLLLGTLGAFPAETRAEASDRQVLIRAAAGLLEDIAARHGLEIDASFDQDEDEVGLLVADGGLTAEQIVAVLEQDQEVGEVETALLASLPPRDQGLGLVPFSEDAQPDVLRTDLFAGPCFAPPVAAPMWNGYADQQAAAVVKLHEAHAARGCGGGVVAIIDTGIDPLHPALVGAVEPGVDFLGVEQLSAASEIADLDHSVRAILESAGEGVDQGAGTLVMLDSMMGPILDPHAVQSVEQADLPPYFGHGTMVAGIVRWVAPGARILPIRVFDHQGSARVFDIARAIYRAVDLGADVINMSFSMPESSQELRRALQYARARGVVCVAAAGNDASTVAVFPAGHSSTIGVAATTIGDDLSTFSNYGGAIAKVAAPGEGIVTTYPGGLYAAGWGTSFSAPQVAGAAALLHHVQGEGVALFQAKKRALFRGAEDLEALDWEVSRGRLDLLGTVTWYD